MRLRGRFSSSSIQPVPPRDCLSHGEYLGAITFLTKDTFFGIQFTRLFTTPETVVVYVLTSLLSVIPILYVVYSYKLWERLARTVLFLIGLCFSATIVLTIPLFIVAADYGRFISIHITCISLTILWVFTIIARQNRSRNPSNAVCLDRNRAIPYQLETTNMAFVCDIPTCFSAHQSIACSTLINVLSKKTTAS